MAEQTSLGLTKPTLNEFYDLLVQNGNIDLLDQLIAARVEKALIANNLLTTAEGMVLDARQGPVIQEKFDTINNNLAQKTTYKTYTINANSTFTIALAQGGAYLVTTAFNSLDAVSTCAVAFGGLANNASLPTRLSVLKTGSNITYSAGNTVGTYHQMVIGNTSAHTVKVTIVSLDGSNIP